MKVGVIIQARMGSTRLPEKIMKDIQGKTVLEHVIERVGQSKLADEIIVATTTNKEDRVIELEALRCGVKAYRGSEDDVLSRYYYAAKDNKLDVVVRITSDCPLIDPEILDEMIQYYLKSNVDIVSNVGLLLTDRTYPRGLDVEIFSFAILEDAFKNAEARYQREHVTPYIYEASDDSYYYKNSIDYSKYRLTLDTDDDFKLISEVYKHLYNGVHEFYLNDIVELFEKIPGLYDINSHIEQKKLNE